MRLTALFTAALIMGIAAAMPAHAQAVEAAQGEPGAYEDTPLGAFTLALLGVPEESSQTGPAPKPAPAERAAPPVSAAPPQPTITPRATPVQSSGGFFSWFQQNAFISPRLRRQVVRAPGNYKPGTIVVNTAERFLYHIQADGTAMRYGIGVGRQGFSWRGGAYVGDKREWPGWTPPPAMRAREPWLPAHMPGGPNNPLGARALYLYKGGKDTLYRIHGTNQPETIGQAVSSGCIRLMNEDIIHLYERVRRGARVVVL